MRLSDIENTHNRIIEEEVGNAYSGGSPNAQRRFESFGVDGEEIMKTSDARHFNSLLADHRVIRKSKGTKYRMHDVTMF